MQRSSLNSSGSHDLYLCGSPTWSTLALICAHPSEVKKNQKQNDNFQSRVDSTPRPFSLTLSRLDSENLSFSASGNSALHRNPL
jgi:hypothetical protein